MTITPKIRSNFLRILDNVVVRAKEAATPIANKKDEIIIGEMSVIKRNKAYDVVSKLDGRVVYGNICIIEAAILLAKYHQLKHSVMIQQLLELERDYSERYADMTFFMNSYKHAELVRDYDKMSIQSSRYDDANLHAKNVKNKIRKMYNGFLWK